MAVKREKPEPLLEDVALCAHLGWTWTELSARPVWFVERMKLYLATLAEKQQREAQRSEEELKRRLEGLKLR